MTPEEQAEAEQPRTLAEEALLALMLIYLAPTPPIVPGLPTPSLRPLFKRFTPAQLNLLRDVFHGLVSGILANVSYQDTQAPERQPDQKIIEQITVPELGKVITSATRVVTLLSDDPPRDPDELPLARQGARDLATMMYGHATDAILGELPADNPDGVLTKQWVSRNDDKVRPLHRRLHGQVRGHDQDFFRWMSGLRLRFPGDPEAPLSEVIGCRCVLRLKYVSQQ